jgi:hypothetical protein
MLLLGGQVRLTQQLRQLAKFAAKRRPSSRVSRLVAEDCDATISARPTSKHYAGPVGSGT